MSPLCERNSSTFSTRAALFPSPEKWRPVQSLPKAVSALYCWVGSRALGPKAWMLRYSPGARFLPCELSQDLRFELRKGIYTFPSAMRSSQLFPESLENPELLIKHFKLRQAHQTFPDSTSASGSYILNVFFHDGCSLTADEIFSHISCNCTAAQPCDSADEAQSLHSAGRFSHILGT